MSLFLVILSPTKKLFFDESWSNTCNYRLFLRSLHLWMYGNACKVKTSQANFFLATLEYLGEDFLSLPTGDFWRWIFSGFEVAFTAALWERNPRRKQLIRTSKNALHQLDSPHFLQKCYFSSPPRHPNNTILQERNYFPMNLTFPCTFCWASLPSSRSSPPSPVATFLWRWAFCSRKATICRPSSRRGGKSL